MCRFVIVGVFVFVAVGMGMPVAVHVPVNQPIRTDVLMFDVIPFVVATAAGQAHVRSVFVETHFLRYPLI